MGRDPAEDMVKEQTLAREMERLAARREVRAGERPWEQSSGVQAVVEAVRDLRFPLSREEVVEKAGSREVQVSKDLRVPLAAVVRKLDEPLFTSPEAFQTAVQRHWVGIRAMGVPEEQRSPTGGMDPRDAWR